MIAIVGGLGIGILLPARYPGMNARFSGSHRTSILGYRVAVASRDRFQATQYHDSGCTGLSECHYPNKSRCRWWWGDLPKKRRE